MNGLTQPPELDRLLPLDGHLDALEDLVANRGDFDALIAAAAEILATAADLYEATAGALFDGDGLAVFPNAVLAGEPGQAQLGLCIAAATITTNDPTHYVHVEIPWTLGAAIRYHIHVEGHSQPTSGSGSAQIVDLRYTGRLGASLGWDAVFDPTGALAPYQYIGSNGHLYLRFKPNNVRYTYLAVHQINVNDAAPSLKPGDVTITTSASATL